MKFRKKTRHASAGFTLIEALVTLVLSAIIFVGLVKEYSDSIGRAHDQKIITATNLKSQSIVQMMGAELRILGNGVPFDQANFQIAEDTLSDMTVTDPIDLTSDNDTIIFRLNESGEVYLLTAVFDPASSLTINLTDVSGLEVNDPIYLSNSVVDKDDGLYGIITGVNAGANTVTINAGYVASPAATFPIGTILEEVPEITFNSPSDWSGITRNSGFGNVLLAPDSRFSVVYLDQAGATITLPLTTSILVDTLRKLRLTVAVRSSRPLTNGTTYTATSSQTFTLRNLNYLF